MSEEKRFCVECLHHERVDADTHLHRHLCHRFKILDMVTGENKPKICHEAYEVMCRGDHWRAKR